MTCCGQRILLIKIDAAEPKNFATCSGRRLMQLKVNATALVIDATFCLISASIDVF